MLHHLNTQLLKKSWEETEQIECQSVSGKGKVWVCAFDSELPSGGCTASHPSQHKSHGEVCGRDHNILLDGRLYLCIEKGASISPISSLIGIQLGK